MDFNFNLELIMLILEINMDTQVLALVVQML